MAWFSAEDDQSLVASARSSFKKFGDTLKSVRGSAKFDSLERSDGTGVDKTSSATRQWQQRAWAYYDEVGELHYGAIFVGACLSRCRLTIGVRDADGNVSPVFDEDGNVRTDDAGVRLPGLDQAEEALAILQGIKSDVDGQSQLLASMGVNLHIAGEFHMVGSDPNYVDTTGQITQPGQVENLKPTPLGEIKSWQVYSTEEFRKIDDRTYERRSAPGATPQNIPAESVHVIRVWRRHPRFSDLPDSSVRAVLDILEELQLLTREVRGEAISRLTNAKVLIIPSEIRAVDDTGDDGQGPEGDSLAEDIVETMMLPITDKGSAAQGVPYLLRPPAEFVDKIKTLDLSPIHSSDSADKRAEAVLRLAQGVDLPVEVTTGHAGTTFANAVQIDDSTFKAHIEPVLEIVADGITSSLLLPALANADSPLVIYYDSTELVARPNRAQDAVNAHDRWAISDAALRSAGGFSDGDAPTDEEVQKRIQIKQLTQVRQTVPATPSQLQDEDQLDPAATDDGSPLDQGPIEDGNNTAGTLQAALSFAAELSVERAVRRAGARIRSKANGSTELMSLVRQVGDPDLAATLGPSRVSALTKNEDLFKSEFEALRTFVQRRTDAEYAGQFVEFCREQATKRLWSPSHVFAEDRVPAVRQTVDA